MKAISGVICGNFGLERIPGYRCSGVYHAKCYRQYDDNRFPVLGDDNSDDSLMGVNDLEPDNPERFKEARDRDHMMLPFQCDMCHFINKQHRLPIAEKSGDDLLIKVIRRANLDSLWARERSTVRSNFAEAKRSVRIKSTFQMDHRILPQLRPFPLEDIWGVGEAVCLLWRTLDAGKNTERIQFGTARRFRTFETNCAQTAVGGLGAVFVGSDGCNYRVTNAPTNSEWFRRFMLGCHRRKGIRFNQTEL